MTNLEKVLETVKDLKGFRQFLDLSFENDKTQVLYITDKGGMKVASFNFCTARNYDEEYINKIRLSKIEFEILESLDDSQDITYYRLNQSDLFRVLKERFGLFKDVDFNLLVCDVLSNCEVVE